jgi:hypothetical protein
MTSNNASEILRMASGMNNEVNNNGKSYYEEIEYTSTRPVGYICRAENIFAHCLEM